MILARGGTPVLRMGAPEDDDLDARGIKPEEYADAMHNALLVAEAGIAGAALKGIAHVGNEIGSAAIPRTLKFFEAVVRRLTFHRRKCCVLNLAVRNKFDPFVPLIPAVLENGGEFGFHDGLYIDPETGEVVDTLAKALATGAIGGYRKFMQQYGIRARVTEFAASKTPLEGYNNWIGTNAFAKLCDDAARVVYAPDGVEFHPYSAFKWDRGEGFEYRDNLPLLNRFAETNRTYEVKDVNMPTNSMHRLKVTGFPPGIAYRNIRTSPAATTPESDIGDLLAGDVVDVTLPPDANGWVQLTRPVDKLTGYALWTGVQTETVEVPPTPKVYQFTDAQMTELRRLTKQQDDTNAAIVDILDSAEVTVPNVGNPF